MRAGARKMPYRHVCCVAMTVPDALPALRKFAIFLALLLVLAVPAAAQEAMDKLKFHPREVVKLRLLLGRRLFRPRAARQFRSALTSESK